MKNLLPAVVALTGSLVFVALGDPRRGVALHIATLVAWGAAVALLPRPGWGPGALFGAAIGVRLILLAVPPGLSDDLYRYLWEGHVAALGGNPYVHPPADPAWDALGPDPIRSLVNHAEVPSAYPPLAIWLWAGLGRLCYDPLSVRLFVGLADALGAFVLARVLAGRGRSLGAAWLYALHPLGAVESAVGGHIDLVAFLCLLLAIHAWDRGRTGVGWATAGALLKLFPVVVVPTLARRRPWVLVPAAVVAILVALPFLDTGPTLLRGIGTYTRHWAFNAPIYKTLSVVMGDLGYRLVAIPIGAATVAWAAFHRRDPAEVALWAGGAFVLLSPTLHPWYLVWVWMPALICGVRAWTVYATLVPLAYAALASYDPSTRTWQEPAWPGWVELLPSLAALGWEAWRNLERPGPAWRT